MQSASDLLDGDHQNHPIALRILSDVRHIHPKPGNAIYALAYIYFAGTEGIKRDLDLRFELLNEGASLGHGMCTLELGWAYHLGEGTEVDDAEAEPLFRLVWEKEVEVPAGHLDESGAMLAKSLCTMYSNRGTAVTREEKEEIISIYEDLRQRKEYRVVAIVNLANFLRSGLCGSSYDLEYSRRMLDEWQWCDDSGKIAWTLGSMFENGEGGTIRLWRAYGQYFVARGFGIEGAGDAMDRIDKKRRFHEIEEEEQVGLRV